MRDAVIILAGGLSLGAYQGGVLDVLLGEDGISPVAVAGSSIGAFQAALIAGSPPGGRRNHIREFWAGTSQPSVWSSSSLMESWASVLTTRLTGARGLFRLRTPFSGAAEMPGLYDASEGARVLSDRIGGEVPAGNSVRCVLATTDIATGETVTFDTAAGQVIDVPVLLASGALLPNFPPVRIGDRLLADGGFSANLPLRPVMDDSPAPLAIAIDLFSADARLPATLAGATARSNDLMFLAQTRHALAALERDWSGGTADLLHLSYRALEDEPEPEKPFDFSSARLAARWRAGMDDGHRALALIEALPARNDGALRVHRVPG